ncbi:unnamed protein product [Adineta ricciae]|uniref:Uncharacterized protein n=1 Tax=Adineta ricciae TaxID=249248 RepID=A0A815SQ42_ADIRI|nr:unnamed protein product [Adineta ricciae]
MKTFTAYCTRAQTYLSSTDYRRLIPVVLVTVLLILSYRFRQCQHISPRFTFSFGKSRNSSDKLTKILVISHYNEDLNWLDLYIGDTIPHIVYTRSTDSLIRHAISVNKGREAVAYLRYIVDHYSNLPSLIAFIHAHRTAWHQTDPSDIVVALRALRWNKYGYMPLTGTTTFAYFQKDSPNLQSVVNFELWTAVLQRELGPPPRSGTKGHCCASFVVRKEEILKHPKQFYSKIIDYIVASRHSDQLTGRTLEYTWQIIFGQPAIVHFRTCDIFYCDAQGRISVKLAEQNL